MKINNIEDLKKNINVSTAFIFFIIFTFALIGLYITHNNFIKKQNYLDHEEIINAENSYKYNLSEKLSIIASSNVFLDYLRSGQLTRQRLHTQFLSQLTTLKSRSIIGMQLIDSSGKEIFNYGNNSEIFLNLKLCYLNQNLDSSMGECSFIWRLYFNKDDLLAEFYSINHEIASDQGGYYHFFKGNYFGSFPIESGSDFKVKLGIHHGKDYFFYIYILLITLTLVVFGAWSWYRLSSVLNKYIAEPIQCLTNCLKSNVTVEQHNNIKEIDYLITEINEWKIKLNKMQADQNAAKLGKIAAQLAHDVRSPLSVIDMIIKNLTSMPEHTQALLRHATQRIADIANNFLAQYAAPSSNDKSEIASHFIPSILENIVAEKQSQYAELDVDIKLIIDESAQDSYSLINAADFARILSNLINNSIEAISKDGKVTITLSKLDHFLRVEIEDNGCGIPSHLLPQIVHGGMSFGKKNGLGLGLSHAIKTIEDWQGCIDIQSCEGSGTKVRIDLPVENSCLHSATRSVS